MEMKRRTKKFYIILTVLVVAIFAFPNFPLAYPIELSTSDEMLSFLEEVVKLDVSKYDVEILGSLVEQPDWLGGLTQITGKMSLTSQTSKLDILYKFTNNTLSWCLVRVIEGLPEYTKTSSSGSIRDAINDFLQSYQTISNDYNLEEMRQMLDTVDVTKNTTKTIDSMELEISINLFSSSFSWKNKFNGAEYNGISVDFKDGDFYSFSDDRSYYKIGGTNVDVTKEEAVNIALKGIEDFSWIVAGEEVKDFRIVEEDIRAELLTRSREPLELYPYWLVSLPLDEIYPGNVNCITVTLWADTSEIIDCHPTGFGGDLLPTQQISSVTEQQLADKTSSTESIVVAVTTIIVGVALSRIVIKKRTKVD